MISALSFIFGTIIGSGINALDWREGKDKSWLADRSECPDCGHALAWWELIPVVSFIFLGGKCSKCSRPISWRYPLVELAAGLLFALIFQVFGISLLGIFSAVIWTLLLFIYVHDGRTMLVPNWAVWTFNILAFVSMFIAMPLLGTVAVPSIVAVGWLQLLAGPILAAPFALIWFLSSGQAMGFADAKIALGIGWLVGLTDGLSAIVFSFWVGAAVSLIILAFQRLWKSDPPAESRQDTISSGPLTMKSPVPFGPFLIIGLILVYFAGITLL